MRLRSKVQNKRTMKPSRNKTELKYNPFVKITIPSTNYYQASKAIEGVINCYL